MTNLTKCTERESLVCLVYEDGEPAERTRLEAHVLECADCAEELDQLRSTHIAMASWPVPEPKGPIVPRLGSGDQPWRVVESPSAGPRAAGAPTRVFAIRWAQAAAAILVIGVSAAIANIEIKYGPDGVTVRTGWQRTTAVPAEAAQPVVTRQTATPAAAPWRGDLASLERQLRTEFSAHVASDAARAAAARTASGPSTADAQALLQRVQQLIADSERRQQRELALRVSQVVRDVDAQRRGDLFRIEQGFGRLEGQTQRELANYIMRVSQKQ